MQELGWQAGGVWAVGQGAVVCGHWGKEQRQYFQHLTSIYPLIKINVQVMIQLMMQKDKDLTASAIWKAVLELSD